MLEKKHVDVPLQFGLDQSTDQQADPQGLLVLENSCYTREGAVVRRQGFDNVDTTVPQARALVKAGPSIGVLDQRGVVSTGASTLVNRLPALSTRSALTGTAGNNVLNTDLAIVTAGGVNYCCVVATTYKETTTVNGVETWGWLYNYDTGELIAEKRLEDNSFYAKVVAVDGAFGITYMQGTSLPHSLKYQNLTVAGTFSSASIVTTNCLTQNPTGNSRQECTYDVLSAGGFHYIAFLNNTTSRVNLLRLTPSGSLTGTRLGTIEVVVGAVSMCLATISGTDYINIAFCSSAPAVEIQSFPRDPLGTPVDDFSSTVVQLPRRISMINNGTQLFLYAENFVTGHLESEGITQASDGSFSGSTGGNTYNGIYLVTKPFLDPVTERVVIGVAPTFSFQSGYRTTWFVAFGSTATGFNQFLTEPHAQLTVDEAPLQEFNNTTVFGPQFGLSSVATIGTKRITCFPADLETAASGQYIPLKVIRRWRVVETDYDTDLPVTWTELNGLAFICGSILQAYDGSESAEASFLTAPRAPIVEADSGSSLSPGLYAYKCLLERVDAQGNLVTSAPSGVTQYTVTGGSDGTPDITVSHDIPTASRTAPNVSVVNESRQFRIKVYRTQADGSVFNLVRSFTLYPGQSATFADNNSNATIASQELFPYAAELASEPAPPLLHLCTHRNRLFGVRGDTSAIAFTKEIVPPKYPEWNAELNIRIDNEGGPATAVASLDDKLIIFQRDQILLTSGDGPDATGESGQFPVPEKIATGCGVAPEEAASVVNCPLGILFRHSSGFYLLDRSLQLSFIGDPVRDTVDAMGTIMSARYLPRLRQVWICGRDSSDILVLDTLRGRWSRYNSAAFTLTGGSKSSRGTVERAGSVYHLVAENAGGAAGHLFRVDPSSKADKATTDGSFLDYTQAVELPWFRGGGHGGMQRVWKVALTFDVITAAAQQVVLKTYSRQDQRPTKASETPDNTYTWSDLSGYPTGALTLTAHLKRQRCSSCKVRVELDQRGSSTAEGMRLTNVRFYFGVPAVESKSPVRPTIA